MHRNGCRILDTEGADLMDLLSILIFLIIIGVVFWAARALMAAFGIGDPIATVVYVLLVVVVIVALLQALGGSGGLPALHLR
jgi:hypothetical protein